MTQEQFNQEILEGTYRPLNDRVLCIVPEVTEVDPATGIVRIPATLERLRKEQLNSPMIVVALGPQVHSHQTGDLKPGDVILGRRPLIMDGIKTGVAGFEYVQFASYELDGYFKGELTSPGVDVSRIDYNL